jgi:hypothetical protein
MGNRYYNDGHLSISEQSFLSAKDKAYSLGDLKLEINITKNYINKFINIRSLAKSIEIVLELKEKAVAFNNS